MCCDVLGKGADVGVEPLAYSMRTSGLGRLQRITALTTSKSRSPVGWECWEHRPMSELLRMHCGRCVDSIRRREERALAVRGAGATSLGVPPPSGLLPSETFRAARWRMLPGPARAAERRCCLDIRLTSRTRTQPVFRPARCVSCSPMRASETISYLQDGLCC